VIPFHRFLITTAILFCVGFAGWAFVAYRASGAGSDLAFALAFAAARAPSPKSARRLFLSTLAYLPVLLGALVANRLV